MKAVYFNEHGDRSVLTYGSLPTPAPGPGEVLVRLNAAALNRADVFVRQGWPGLKLRLPHITGSDGAGEIAAVGEGVRDRQPGERVVINANLSCGMCRYCLAGEDNRCVSWDLLGEVTPGTYAEYVVIPARNAVLLPDHISFVQAAAASLVFHTAWHSLITRGNLRPGESVLIVGASGGVNTASIQVAKAAGATVYVVGSSADKLSLAKSLGADVLLDRSVDENWSRQAYEASGRQGLDVVVDNVGAPTFMLSLRALRKGGRLLTVGNTAGPKLELDNRYLFAKHLSILGSTMGTHEDFRQAMAQVFAGKLRPVVDQVFPLQEASAAQARLEAGEQMGKIILEP